MRPLPPSTFVAPYIASGQFRCGRTSSTPSRTTSAIVTAISGLEGTGIGAMQALIGVGSIAGIAGGGRSADKAGGARLVGLSFLLSAASLSSYSVLMLASPGPPAAVVLLSAAMLLGAAPLFARMPVIPGPSRRLAHRQPSVSARDRGTLTVSRARLRSGRRAPRLER